MATKNAKFPYLFIDESGKCLKGRMPHVKGESCMDHCVLIDSFYPPGFGTNLKCRYLAFKLIGTPFEAMMYDHVPLKRS